MTTKEQLLEHYKQREPRRFRQYDGMKLDGPDITAPDHDGHALTRGDTWELMEGADVRVLIPHGTDTPASDIISMLHKIAKWIERDLWYKLHREFAEADLAVMGIGDEWAVISLSAWWDNNEPGPVTLETGLTSKEAAELRRKAFIVNVEDDRKHGLPHDRGSEVPREYFNGVADGTIPAPDPDHPF